MVDGMNSLLDRQGFEIIAVFFIGFVAGWLASKIRMHTRIRFSILPPGSAQSDKPIFETKLTREVTIKCKCGTTTRYCSGLEPLPADCLPFPKGGPFICPKCGKTTELAHIQKDLFEAAQ